MILKTYRFRKSEKQSGSEITEREQSEKQSESEDFTKDAALALFLALIFYSVAFCLTRIFAALQGIREKILAKNK